MKHKNKQNKVSTSEPDTSLSFDSHKKNIFTLIILSLLFKIMAIGFVIFIFRSYIDYYDLRIYATQSILLANGQLPYLSFDYAYSILSVIPIMLSVSMPILFNDLRLVFPMFQMLMIVFDVMTTICVYLIALKIYNSKKTALISGIIYTLSLCAAYTCLTRFDSFPVFLLLLSITLILYKDSNGYFINIMGFFTKVFPIIALPFLLLYEDKVRNSFRLNVRNIVITSGIFAGLLIIPFIYLVGWEKATKPYLFATGTTSVNVYANTLTYALYGWIHDVFKIGLDISILSSVMSVIMIVLLLGLVFIAYKMERISELNLIQFIGAAILISIIFTKFHSPQYFMWFTPLFAIVVAKDIYKILVFFIVQIISFIEFPIMFGIFYTNPVYVSPVGSYGWYVALLFFTIEYIFIFLLLYQNLFETIKYNIRKYILGEIE